MNVASLVASPACARYFLGLLPLQSLLRARIDETDRMPVVFTVETSDVVVPYHDVCDSYTTQEQGQHGKSTHRTGFSSWLF
jgi:hypothetical protein